MDLPVKFLSATDRPQRKRTASPRLESLESRLLLYGTLGAQWAYGSRITYSFVPDGTDVGGSPSVLFQTLNAKFATATWQSQFQRAAAVWQAVAEINLAQVSDDGTAIGANGNQQGDPRFGDIRIAAVPQASGTLAACFLPPPINGGSDAGDIVFNSSLNWQINSGYDIQTVAIHELGHALGMSHSQIVAACMYANYNGIKQSLTSDDTSGIQSIYGAPQYDQFNSHGHNNGSFTRAANINSYIDASSQIAIPGLDITTGSQSEWFYVTVPSSTTGTMTVTMQSSNLSSLSPKLSIYTTSLGVLGTASSSAYGGTVSVSVSGLQSGQSFYIRASGNAAGSATGGFGLEVNFGSQWQPPIPPPYTVVPQQPDQAGGSMMAQSMTMVSVGSLLKWGEILTTSDLIIGTPRPVPIRIGSQAGIGLQLAPFGPVNVVGPSLVQVQSTTASGSDLPIIAAPPNTGAAARTLLVYQACDEVLGTWKPNGLSAF